MTKKVPKTSEELMGAIDELLDAVPPLEISECDSELEACGFDPVLVGARLERAARDAMSTSTLNWRVRARAERAAALQRFESTARTFVVATQDVGARIKELLAQVASMPEAPALRAHFHKLAGKASDDELGTLLTELEFLHSQLKDKKESE